MVRRNTAIMLGVVLAAGTPVAGASKTCSPSTDPNAIEVDGMDYVQERLIDGQFVVTVYAESNGLSGLQTSSTPCGYGEPRIPPDTKITTLSRTL